MEAMIPYLLALFQKLFLEFKVLASSFVLIIYVKVFDIYIYEVVLYTFIQIKIIQTTYFAEDCVIRHVSLVHVTNKIYLIKFTFLRKLSLQMLFQACTCEKITNISLS